MTAITQRFTHALDYARIAHAAQFRKGTEIPYLYHLMGVASLVLEHGGNEDQAIAGLLHDLIEDCGEPHADMIRAQFGDVVANIVRDCTDGSAEQKKENTNAQSRREDWIRRKLRYIAHLEHADNTTLLVSGCDKLHNARAILIDLENPEVGEKVFSRFTGGKDGTLRYYHSLAAIFTKHNVRMANELDRTVARMHELAGATQRANLTAAGEMN